MGSENKGTMGHETRSILEVPRIETRADGKEVIRGIAPIYYREGDAGTEFPLWRGVVERVRLGAAKGAIGADVRSFFNHDPSLILGRTKAGTLALRETDKGLEYEVTPPDTQAGRDVIQSIRRGDVDGSSFMFRVKKESWEVLDDQKGDVRWLEELEIFEVGPVSMPAYKASPAGIGRDALEFAEARASREKWMRETPSDPLDLHRRQLDLLQRMGENF